ncbi:hypothetical protein [Clostridium sp. KNHs205]|jgi:hypothetical protein|uniref:hypothetical protein n=1 Tax=Clostridium sp. KNHs205 TaxID=1449050 RepID=UPI00051B24D8|nr:hypothetical protein [Clostridium sp. KNHs205]
MINKSETKIQIELDHTYFKDNDIYLLNNEVNTSHCVEFVRSLPDYKYSSGEDIAVIVFTVLNGVGINALYDIIKCSFFTLINYLKKNNVTKIDLYHNGKKTRIRLNFSLSNEEQSKIVDSIVTLLAKDDSGSANND